MTLAAIDIVQMSAAWAEAGLSAADLDDLARRAVEAARAELGARSTGPAGGAGRTGPSARTAAIVFADDALLQRLNSEHRGVDRPTNVLAFPALTPAELAPATREPEEIGAGAEAPHARPQPQTPLQEMSLGDVVLALETIAREAAQYGVSVHDRTVHMIVHGYLHLHGYDHQTEDDAEEMESMERRSLARLGLADPYGAR